MFNIFKKKKILHIKFGNDKHFATQKEIDATFELFKKGFPDYRIVVTSHLISFNVREDL